MGKAHHLGVGSFSVRKSARQTLYRILTGSKIDAVGSKNEIKHEEELFFLSSWTLWKHCSGRRCGLKFV